MARRFSTLHGRLDKERQVFFGSAHVAGTNSLLQSSASQRLAISALDFGTARVACSERPSNCDSGRAAFGEGHLAPPATRSCLGRAGYGAAGRNPNTP